MLPKTTRWAVAATVLFAVTLPTATVRAEDPEKQPPPPAERRRGEDGPRGRPEAGARRGPGGPGQQQQPGQAIENLRGFLKDLNLSEEQKTKVEAALQTAAEDFRELRGEAQSMEPRERREQVESILDTLRREVNGALDEQQRQALRKKMEQFRPAGGQRPGGEGTGPATRPGPLLEQLRGNLAKLDLSDDQKKKIEAVFADVREQMGELREALGAGDEAAREKLGQIGMDVHRQLREILTEDQARELREMMPPPPGRGGDGAQGPPQGERRRRGGPGGNDEMMNPDEMRPGGNPDNPRPRQRPPRDQRRRLPTTGPAPGAGATIGSPAPEFELTRLDGKPVRLSSFQGRVGVLVFGSYSCPSFRQRAAALDNLSRQFGARAQFLIVYTKEAHPAGAWDVERNKDEGIAVQPHADAEGRLVEAKKAKDKLKLTIPLAPDTMDDAVANAFGGFPNGAVVLSRDGVVLSRQQWVDPDGLERRIEQALKVPASKPAASDE